MLDIENLMGKELLLMFDVGFLFVDESDEWLERSFIQTFKMGSVGRTVMEFFIVSIVIDETENFWFLYFLGWDVNFFLNILLN